jgi:hypothetical protein
VQQFRQRQLTGAATRAGVDLGRTRPALQGDEHRPTVGEPVQVELELGLQGRYAFVHRDLPGERTEQCRLADGWHARHQDAAPRDHERGQELGHLRGHRSGTDEIGQRHVDEAVPTDGHDRARRDVPDGRQP